MSTKTVLLIVGSFRKNSFNQIIADYIAKELKKDVNVEFLDYRNVPLLEQDTEFPAPQSVKDVRDQVGKADAVWVLSLIHI